MSIKKKHQPNKPNIDILTQEEFRKKYNELRPQYERLAVNLQQALKAFLAEENIPYLDVLFRVKDVDSAYEKIARKEFNNPFEQIEDWCGLRIICYYPSDVDRICEIIVKEFDIQTQEDTAKRLKPKEFGYRSTHFILKIKASWMQPPNYRGLEKLKAEIQVRTILMHAWAEVEHKLQYKSSEQVPEQFQRKLYFLSAKFEEADGQFEELRKGISEYRASIQEAVTNVPAFRNQELNLDTLQAFLDEVFPERKGDIKAIARLLEELNTAGVTMEELVDSYEIAKPHLSELENIWFNTANRNEETALAKPGMMRIILDTLNQKYYEYRRNSGVSSNWSTVVSATRSLMNNPAQ
ncbi:hypothetical protein GCM10027594_21970 [Hymenobacter agri]